MESKDEKNAATRLKGLLQNLSLGECLTMNLLMIILTVALPIFSFSQKKPECYGVKKDLVVASQMPYVLVSVSGFEGYFLVDFGTTASTIDPAGFIGGGKPSPTNNTTSTFDNFDFYGSWGTVNLNVQDHSHIQGIAPIKQAGIIGTDFLSSNVYTIDYINKAIYRANSGTDCPAKTLVSEGFKSVSTQGYYSNDLSKLNNNCTANIPTVILKIGNATAAAQLDPGFDDKLFSHSININQAFYNSLISAGVVLEAMPDKTLQLSTCVSGVAEQVLIYKLPKGVKVEIVGADGIPFTLASDAHLCVKQTPPEAKSCGGIGTWQIPAAQVAASILKDSKAIVFDPFKSRVWFKTE